jgi:hypothetical protein
MKTQEARELGERIAALVQDGQVAHAYERLSPVLAQRTPFAMLRRIGAPVGAGPLEPVNAFLESIAAHRTEGGWVVIASALKAQLDRDLAGSFARCRSFIVAERSGKSNAGEHRYAPTICFYPRGSALICG